MSKLASLKKSVGVWQTLISESAELTEYAKEFSDKPDIEKEIFDRLNKLEKVFNEHEVEALLSGEFDQENALLFVHSGTGGIDAQDFSEMLLRMYLRYSEKQNWPVEVIDKTIGEEAGIKSACVEIKGLYAYGFLKGEGGIHRLVRMSPFDSDGQRHTSFALVEVIPDISNQTNFEIKPEELRIDVFRSGGKGGQGVNTTDSAVRITHLASGITVSCQNERSQTQNKATALRVLQARLTEKNRKEEEQKMAVIRGEHLEASWGNQIRSYVMQPYQMVKDHRSKEETAGVNAVLDGDLNQFIQGYLRWHKSRKN